MVALHDDELKVDAELVRRLLGASLPALAGERVRPLVSSGSSNALFRIGDNLVARFPRQPGGSASIDTEARWLPHLARFLTTRVPEIVAIGTPGFGYPERWLVTRWIEGERPDVPDGHGPRDAGALPTDLARFVSQLGSAPVPPDAAALSWYRGGHLSALIDDFETSLEQCRNIPGLDLDLDGAERIWHEALEAEQSLTPERTWVHGDLLAENILVHEGHLSAVLDFGSLSVGDPTVDLVVAWEVLDAHDRRVFRHVLDIDDARWKKAMGWAQLIALVTFPYYWDTMPSRCADRRSMAAAVLAEA